MAQFLLVSFSKAGGGPTAAQTIACQRIRPMMMELFVSMSRSRLPCTCVTYSSLVRRVPRALTSVDFLLQGKSGTYFSFLNLLLVRMQMVQFPCCVMLGSEVH